MISSLSSRFNRGSRRAMCLTSDAVTIYHWQGGEITDTFQFDVDDTGRFHFTRYLQETLIVPTYLMVDVVEEEFRTDTIPHVMGSDRKNLIRRKLSRNFRNTPYVHHLMQGREKNGRKDDKILFTALTNQNAITPWIKLIEQYKVPLAGIYSLPILSKALLKPLKATNSNVLLVSMGSSSGLRQTYFRDQQLQISRLARLPRFGTAPYGPYVKGELEKIYRYLNNLRLVSREEPLDIYILAHGELLADLRKRMSNTGSTRYHLIDTSTLSREVGVDVVLTTPFSDYMYAHLLLSETPKNHYGSADDTYHYSMHNTRVGLFAASMLLLLGAAGWSGYNFINGISLKHQSIEASQKAAFYKSRYEIAKKDLPPTAVKPADIKGAITIIDTLMQHKTTPFLMMNSVSEVLRRYPDLQIDAIDWVAGTDPNKHPLSNNLALEEPAEINAKSEYPYYQIATIKGHLAPFDGNYRKALGVVKRFANSMKAQKDVHHVTIDSLPLDISPESSLSGETKDSQIHGAEFALTVVMGVNNES
jgi:hypothetical protein